MRRVRGHVVWTIVVVWTVIAGLLAPAMAQEAHVPAGHAQVIASGWTCCPSVDVAWRITANIAQPGDEAEFFDRTLGFVVANEEPVLVTDGATGNSSLVDTGQALFQPEGTSQRRSSVSNDESAYLGIDLIVAEDVDDDDTLGSADLLFAGEGFEAPDGTRDIRLTRDLLSPAEEGTFEATSDAPYLFYVAAGAIQVDDGDDHLVELREGQAAEFSGDISLLAGANQGGAWLVASIGEEVEVPPLPTREADETGTLEMRLEVCPDGYDEDCEPDADREVVPLAFHHVDDENWIIPDRAEWSEDDTVLTYDELPAGEYTTAPEDDPQDNIRVRGGDWNDDEEGWEWEIEPGETTVIRVQLDTSEAETGALVITLYDCGIEEESVQQDSGCELSDETWPIWIAPPDGGLDDALWLDEDAEATGSSEYLFDDLPAGTWDLSPDGDGPDGPIQVTVDGDAYEIPGLWAVDIEPGKRPRSASPGSCRTALASKPARSSSTCTTARLAPTPPKTPRPVNSSTDPWNVAVELAGQSDTTTWTLFEDAIEVGDGEYWFELLPATTLTLGRTRMAMMSTSAAIRTCSR